MFLRIEGKDSTGFVEKKVYRVNTSKIVAVREGDEPRLYLDGNWGIDLTGDMLATVLQAIDSEESTPAAKVKEDGFMSQLNVLLGGQQQVKETDDRKRKLKSRLKDFTADELRTAAKNLGDDEYMQGDNDSGKRWGTLDYLLRSSANVNKWLEHEAPKKKKSMF